MGHQPSLDTGVQAPAPKAPGRCESNTLGSDPGLKAWVHELFDRPSYTHTSQAPASESPCTGWTGQGGVSRSPRF